MGVELLAGDAGLDQAVEVLGVDLEHLVHLPTDRCVTPPRSAAMWPSSEVPVPNGIDRDPVAGADRHDRLTSSVERGEGDRIGRRARMVGLVLAVALAHRAGGGQPLAEQRAELVESGGKRGRAEIVHGSGTTMLCAARPRDGRPPAGEANHSRSGRRRHSLPGASRGGSRAPEHQTLTNGRYGGSCRPLSWAHRGDGGPTSGELAMASTPLEQDQPTPSRIQRVIMAATRPPRPGSGAAEGARDGAAPAAADARALPLARASLRIEDGVLMAFGPEGDPIPPATFVAAAAAQPNMPLAWSDGRTVSSKRVAAVLEAQAHGPLLAGDADRKGGEPWLRAMLGLGPQPEPASDAELRDERRVCELTVFGHELMITMPSGRSFLVAEAAPAHHASAAGLILADGRPVSVRHLVDRLRAHGEQGRRPGGASGGQPDGELALPDCGAQSVEEELQLQLPAVGAVRLAQPGKDLHGPRVSIFLASGEPASVADLIAELGRAGDPAEPEAGLAREAISSPAAPAPAPPALDQRAAADAPPPAVPMAAPVPLAIRLPSPAGFDAEQIALVMIGDMPAGATLSAGAASGDRSWMLSSQDLAGLTLTLPAGHTAAIALKVTALAIQNRDGELATAADTVRVSLDAASPIPLGIDPAVLEAAGPGLNAVLIRDLPPGASLSAGTYDPTIDGWVLLPRQLDGLTLTPGAERASGILTLMGISLGAGGRTPQTRILARLPIAPR